jgi:hypothetical protein
MYVYGGYALREQRRAGGWVSGAAAVLMSTLRLHEPAMQSPLAIVMNLVVLGLILANWRRLGRS